MAVGLPLKTTYANGDVYSASDVNDTNGTVNLIGQTTNFFAGKNKIINGDMRIWQRGTSLSNAGVVYGADRWQSFSYSGSSSTIAQQTFTPGTAPVAGYEGQFFLRITSTNTQTIVWQNMEDVRTYAGQTVTVSFWAKVASAVNLGASISQQFGSGGSGAVNTTITLASAGATTSWQRFTGTVAVPSISGKTIGTSSYLQLNLFHVGINNALDIWGVQLEAGSTATAFQTATGTIQGELAACQRYYYRTTTNQPFALHGIGFGRASGSTADVIVRLPVTMRITSQTVEYANLQLSVPGSAGVAISSLTASDEMSQDNAGLAVSATVTNAKPYFLGNSNNTAGYVAISAEL
jgi:hypothetical protein